jgi:hypothetical protein
MISLADLLGSPSKMVHERLSTVRASFFLEIVQYQMYSYYVKIAPDALIPHCLMRATDMIVITRTGLYDGTNFLCSDSRLWVSLCSPKILVSGYHCRRPSVRVFREL